MELKTSPAMILANNLEFWKLLITPPNEKEVSKKKEKNNISLNK